jgi:predicted regulator of Ras-like GTPase activity (Roadblock/LC7/MglB family)
VDPAQALADLTEISSQIEAAVLAEESGTVIASTFTHAGRAERAARAAAELLRAAEGAGRPGLVQLEAATQLGSVFVVRDGRRILAAATGASPTAGLVFYDLKTTLRLAAEEPAPQAAKPRARRRKKDGEEGSSEAS